MALMPDGLFEAQLIRAMAYASSGGAELGEMLGTAERITKADAELWYSEWLATAERAAQQAQSSTTRIDARNAWFRASNYFRTAGIFLMGAPVDPRFRDTSHRATEAFREGAKLLDNPAEPVRIPYQETTLPGYFFRAGDGRRATMILTNGYDGIVEELYFALGAAALERGYHVLAFDGPGQGSVILDQEIPFRPDWEAVVTPVVDFALTRPEVDADALVLYGWSFGGYLAPRAASGEHRLAACIADSGPADILTLMKSRFPGDMLQQVLDGDATACAQVDHALGGLMGHPTAGWSMRRNLWVHQLGRPSDYVRMAQAYSMSGREQLIDCPTFFCTTEGDDLGVQMSDLAARVGDLADFVLFRNADDVTGHCEMSNRAALYREVFSWLDRILRH